MNTFTYDANLVRRSAEDSDGLANFINDGQNVLQETDSGGTTQVAYTLEPQTYGNLISQRRSGATNWHLFDGLGSTERLTDAAEDAAATYLHKAFGITSILSGSSSNRYTWIGKLGYRWEPDAGEYDVRRRRMGQEGGRWLTRDPLYLREKVMRLGITSKILNRYPASLNSEYIYCVNRPIDEKDPMGLEVYTRMMAKRVIDCVFWSAEDPNVSIGTKRIVWSKRWDNVPEDCKCEPKEKCSLEFGLKVDYAVVNGEISDGKIVSKSLVHNCGLIGYAIEMLIKMAFGGAPSIGVKIWEILKEYEAGDPSWLPDEISGNCIVNGTLWYKEIECQEK